MDGGSQSGDDLMVRIRAGDRAACEELVRRHYASVYRFLLHLTADPERAADCTQDTFRAAWQKLSDFNGRSTVASWLHRIAYNRFIDAYRKYRRDQALHEGIQIERFLISDDVAPCAATIRDSSRYLEAAVEQLPEDQRTIVVLHYFEGMSLNETAAVVEQPVGTVKWRLSEALKHLRTIVDAESVQ